MGISLTSLSSAEKEHFLRALEEDRSFRYAVMGLLGFKEILERITKLEERFAKLEERQQRLEERFAQLEERFTRLEERFARLEERQQRLEEKFAKLEERFLRIEEEMRETRRVVMVIAHRFGVISEEGFREAMKYVVEDVLGAGEVSRWVHKDVKGVVYGYPSIVEVDVLVRSDGTHILLEVKSRVGKGDVLELSRIGRLYEEVEGIKPKLVIIGGFIDKGVEDLAKKLGIEIRPIFTYTPF